MSDYLSEEEQVARMKSWWDEYGMSVIVGLLIAVLGIVGWRWYDGYRAEQSVAAANLFIEYQQANADQEDLVEQLSKQFPGSAYHVLTLLDQAKKANVSGNPDAARDFLQQAVSQGDDDLLIDLARIRLAKVQHELDLTDAALTTLAAIRHEGYRSWAMETKGDIHISRDEIELAHEAYTAAQQSLTNTDERPVLQMKVQNTAPYDGTFVQLEDVVNDALREAESVLREAQQTDAEEPAAVTE